MSEITTLPPHTTSTVGVPPTPPEAHQRADEGQGKVGVRSPGEGQALLVHLAQRVRSAKSTFARLKSRSPAALAVALAVAEGAYLEAWNSLQSAKAVHVEGAPSPITVLCLDGRYSIDGRQCTGEQLQHAVRCSAVLAMAYELAAGENGGDGSVRWKAVDEASREAANALGVSALAELIAEAQSVNRAKR